MFPTSIPRENPILAERRRKTTENNCNRHGYYSIEKNPTLKDHIINAGKEVRSAALDAAVDHPAIKVFTAMVKGAIEASANLLKLIRLQFIKRGPKLA